MSLHTKIRKNLFLLKLVYKFFIIISVSIFVYLVADIFLRSRTSIKFTGKKTIENQQAVNKIIRKPRVQLEPNETDFHFVTADRGIWDADEDSVDLYDVKVESTLGTAQSETLTIRNDNSIFEFRGEPVFVLNLDTTNSDEKETKN